MLLLDLSSNDLQKFQLLQEEIAQIIQGDCTSLDYLNIKKNKQFDNLASKLSSTTGKTFEAVAFLQSVYLDYIQTVLLRDNNIQNLNRQSFEKEGEKSTHSCCDLGIN